MLAYVFWHWPRPEVAVADYEAHMRAFLDALSEQGPSVLRAARAWRIAGASWLPSGSGYADWYLVDDSAALDALNAGAVSGPLAAPHNTVAALAAGGAAGLYGTVPGSSDPSDPSDPADPATLLDGATVHWFAKPAGMPYPDLYARLAAVQTRLWRRRMVLGPTPEFCLLEKKSDEGNVPLPAAWHPLVVRREPVWPADTQR